MMPKIYLRENKYTLICGNISDKLFLSKLGSFGTFGGKE